MHRLILIVLVLVMFNRAEANSFCNRLPIVTFAGWNGNWSDLEDGFCVDDSVNLYWQPGLPNWRSHNVMPTYFHTRAIWQDRGVIEYSAEYNGIDLNFYDGAIALTSCEMVGDTVFIRRDSNQRWRRVVVADCASREHAYFHTVYVRSGLELQYELAVEYGMFDQETVGIYGFQVCTSSPEQCAGEPVDLREWYLVNVSFQ